MIIFQWLVVAAVWFLGEQRDHSVCSSYDDIQQFLLIVTSEQVLSS
jgi:hypothetical protein